MCPSQAKALLNLKQMLSRYISTSVSEELQQMCDTQTHKQIICMNLYTGKVCENQSRVRNREVIFVTDEGEVKSLKAHAETAKTIRKRS